MEFWDGSGISWTICKQSAPHSRQTTTSTPHHSCQPSGIYVKCTQIVNSCAKTVTCSILLVSRFRNMISLKMPDMFIQCFARYCGTLVHHRAHAAATDTACYTDQFWTCSWPAVFSQVCSVAGQVMQLKRTVYIHYKCFLLSCNKSRIKISKTVDFTIFREFKKTVTLQFLRLLNILCKLVQTSMLLYHKNDAYQQIYDGKGSRNGPCVVDPKVCVPSTPTSGSQTNPRKHAN